MFATLLKNRMNRNSSGFTLIELLVAMGIAALLGVVILKSYKVSIKISKHTLYSANIARNVASLQSYMNYLITNAGAALVPEQAIRTYNDQSCHSSISFIQKICTKGFPKLANNTDVIAIAYGLPFTAPSAVDMTRYAAQVIAASPTNFTLSKGSPLTSVIGTSLENFYINRVFMVYSFSKPSAAYLGYITRFSTTGTPPDISVVVNYSNLKFTSPFASGAYPNVPSVFNANGNNAKMVMADIEVIYLDENGNVVDAFWGPKGNIIVRTIASGVEVMQIRYQVIDSNGNLQWIDDVTTANAYRRLLKMRMGLVFTDYYSYKKLCVCKNSDECKKIKVFGKDYTTHVKGHWRFDNPCSYYKVVYLEFPFTSIRSFVTALGG